MTVNKVALSLGSNIGDREGQLLKAIELINEIEGTQLIGKSQIYQTEPQGYKEQENFLNTAILVSTELNPQELYEKLNAIELLLKKNKTKKDGPRTINIDIIYWNEDIIEEENLKIPHPRATQREFVLKPLAELIPDTRDPNSQKTVKELLINVEGKQNVTIWTKKK